MVRSCNGNDNGGVTVTQRSRYKNERITVSFSNNNTGQFLLSMRLTLTVFHRYLCNAAKIPTKIPPSRLIPLTSDSENYGNENIF
jgi:hypothetical protein